MRVESRCGNQAALGSAELSIRGRAFRAGRVAGDGGFGLPGAGAGRAPFAGCSGAGTRAAGFAGLAARGGADFELFGAGFAGAGFGPARRAGLFGVGVAEGRFGVRPAARRDGAFFCGMARATLEDRDDFFAVGFARDAFAVLALDFFDVFAAD
ncbi:MAG TPA: hypothetical protein VMS56_12450 [Thermoanaerobaculia bacterium]|nr:hypothetical protein [Thermoanaerobaculia bacterium]